MVVACPRCAALARVRVVVDLRARAVERIQLLATQCRVSGLAHMMTAMPQHHTACASTATFACIRLQRRDTPQNIDDMRAGLCEKYT